LHIYGYAKRQTERIPPAAGLGGQSAMSPSWRVFTKVAMACTHKTVTDRWHAPATRARYAVCTCTEG